MDSIGSWVLQMCICTIAVAVAENLLPEGSVRKSVYFILGLIVLMCFVSPLKSFSLEALLDVKADMQLPDENTAWFDRMTEDTFKANMTVLVEDCLSSINITAKDIEIFTDIDDDNCISISKVRITIPQSESESIDLISQTVYRDLGLDADVNVR